MDRGFVFDSWYWIVSIRYYIARKIVELVLIILPPDERKILSHQIASTQVFKDLFNSNKSKTKTER